MKLHNLLNEQLILLDRPTATKEEAISLLLKTFLSHYPFKLPQEDITRAVLEREALGGTSFPTGIAVPHARLDNLNDMVILVLRPSVPIPDPVEPIRLMVLMLTSQSKPALYLNSLSGFLKLSQKQDLFGQMLRASHPREFLDLVASQDYSLVKVITVEDIMSTELLTIKPDRTLGELADFFYQHHISYAPVVDDDSHVLGEVSLADLMQIGFPDYASQMGNLKFLKTFESFETLLQQEELTTVKEIMKPLTFACDPSASVVEVSFEFLQKGRRHCPVLKGRRVIGVLSVMDILNKVIRG